MLACVLAVLYSASMICRTRLVRLLLLLLLLLPLRVERCHAAASATRDGRAWAEVVSDCSGGRKVYRFDERDSRRLHVGLELIGRRLAAPNRRCAVGE